MPQHKSAKRRVRTSKRRTERNKVYKTKIKTVIKKIREVEEKEVGVKALPEASAVLDKMARKGIIHKNKANNLKSKLAKTVNKLSAAKTESK